MNSLINDVHAGDNLDILKKIESNSIQMVYCDPPFYTQKSHKLYNNQNKKYEFEDTWNSLEEYIEFLKVRFIELKRVLKTNGLIFIHCDRSASHYIRVLLDEVFGYNNFQSEIIWRYKRWSNSKKGLLNNHQNIYMYSKTRNFKFNTILEEYSPSTNIDQILQNRERINNKTVYQLDEEDNTVLSKPKKGVPLSDVWEIPFLNPKAKERVGYPTQKPIILLERIIEISTDENDIVLDPFCGSGTTLVASKILGRKYIGIDFLDDAVELTKNRLNNPIKTNSGVLDRGLNSYNTKTKSEQAILTLLNATTVQRNNAVDGFLPEYIQGLPAPVRIQKPNESISSIINLMNKNSKTKKSKVKIIIKTNETSQQSSLFEQSIPNDILVIDDLNLEISKLIK